MPALSLYIDGMFVASVNTDGYDILDVRVHGTFIDKNIASLEFSGGAHPEGSASSYLTWVSDLPIKLKQVVKVVFLEKALTSHDGKTIEELFPDEPDQEPIDFKPLPEAINEIRAKPKLRSSISFMAQSPKAGSIYSETEPDMFGFGFGVLWNSWHPERASVSLHSYSLESLESRGPMNYILSEKISIGSEVQFEVLA
jgi:hypothetical protein